MRGVNGGTELVGVLGREQRVILKLVSLSPHTPPPPPPPTTPPTTSYPHRVSKGQHSHDHRENAKQRCGENVAVDVGS